MAITNRQVLLKSRPAGIPQAENFEIVAVQRKVPQTPGLPISNSLGVLGLSGLTAYFGLLAPGGRRPRHRVRHSVGGQLEPPPVGRAWSATCW